MMGFLSGAISQAEVQRRMRQGQRSFESSLNYLINMTYSEDDPRSAAVARQKREEREHNMRVWGRPDDPRLDPTSEFYDPLKLVHKDIDKESEA